MRVWIDTDVGTNPDDGVALLLAVAHPAIEVVGISTVSGDTVTRARVARAYVADPSVPIVAGAGEPRTGEAPAPRWLGHEGDGPLGDAPAASDALARVVDRARPDVLIALGPLTNVAMLLGAGAARAIVAMAGVTTPVWHRGELVRTDHNVASDPDAAAVVLQQARDVLTVPLDVTVRLRLSDREAAELAGRHPRLRHEIAAWLAGRGDAVVLHDPLVVLEAVPGEHAMTGIRTTLDRPGRWRVTDVDPSKAIARTNALLDDAQEPR